MGRWDNRDGDAYSYYLSWVPECDPEVSKWWTDEQTAAVRRAIKDLQWAWIDQIFDYLAPTIDDVILKRWAERDPRIRRYSHRRGGRLKWYRYNSRRPLVRHAHAVAHERNLVDEIRASERLQCARCRLDFDESSLPTQWIYRLGVDRLEFCSPCLTDTLVSAQSPEFGKKQMAKRDMISWILELTELTGRILPQSFGYQERGFLLNLSRAERCKALELVASKPSLNRIKTGFGSWFGLLVASGILEEGSQQLARGTKSLARDGHVCLSLGERTIDDLLTDLGIAHTREPPYAESRMRGDFKIGNVIVEYLGLSGDPDYDQKTDRKIAFAKANGIQLLLIRPRDLVNVGSLARKLRECESA